MTIDVNKVIDVGQIVVNALQKEADKPSNQMTNQDVNNVAPVVQAKVEDQLTKQVQPVIDHLTNNEPWYQSRQTWVAILGLLSSVLAIFGVAFPAEVQAQVLGIITAIVGIITTGTLIYNRYFAKKPIGQ